MSSVPKLLGEISDIPPPPDPNVADEFDNLRAVVEWHVAASGARPRGHPDLIREIDVRIKDGHEAEAALRNFAVPTTPADLATRNNALLKGARKPHGLPHEPISGRPQPPLLRRSGSPSRIRPHTNKSSNLCAWQWSPSYLHLT
jgi:hypothetical protein